MTTEGGGTTAVMRMTGLRKDARGQDHDHARENGATDIIAITNAQDHVRSGDRGAETATVANPQTVTRRKATVETARLATSMG